jgi:hypothetical protein
MNAMNAAIAFALGSYSVQENAAPIVKVTEQKLVKTQKNKKPVAKQDKSCEVSSAKVDSQSAPIASIKLPEKGSLGAKGFIVMMRNAKDRNEKILAIAAFNGYDTAKDYGSQEMAANMAAKRELNPIVAGPDRQVVRSAQRSAVGYVKGMPDGQAVKLQDLLGREKLAVETMLSEQKLCDACVKGSAEAIHHAGLALLEQERLDYIQAEIRSMVG